MKEISNKNNEKMGGELLDNLMGQILSEQMEENDPTEIISKNIINSSPNSIQDLINTETPSEHVPYLIFLMRAPPSFFKKYCDRETINRLRNFVGMSFFTGYKDLIINYDINGENKYEPNNENFNSIEKENEIIKRIELTDRIKKTILNIFEEIEEISEKIIYQIFVDYSKQKSEKLKELNEDYYYKMNQLYKKIKANSNKFFYFLDYEDFLLLFCKIIKYYTKLDLKISFSDLPNAFLLSIFGDDEKLSGLAEINEYELQLKSYAIKFDEFKKEKKRNKKIDLNDDINNINSNSQINNNLIEKSNGNNNYVINNQWIPLKYENMDYKNVLHWPPYKKYTIKKDEKFQRYDKGDNFHECNVTFEGEEICEECSKFRNIDKLRIIFGALDKIIKINSMIKENLLVYVLFKRNYVDYGDNLEFKNIMFDSWNVFDKKKTMKFIYIVRNYFGEPLAYYFLWLTDFIKWHLFPSIIGILFYVFLKFKNDHSEFFLVLFSAILLIWASAFLYQWRQKEVMFNYFWGNEGYHQLEPDSEKFKPEGYKELILNIKIPYVRKRNKYTKEIVSYCVLVGMLSISIISCFIFNILKKILCDKYPQKSTMIGFCIATLSTFQMKITYYIYLYFATKFNDWENHQKNNEKINSLSIKLILFDFVNDYVSLFYIAFLKKHKILIKPVEKCYGFSGRDSCLEEIEIVLYTYFLIFLMFDFMEIGWPIFDRGVRLVSLKKSLSLKKQKLDLSPQSLEHQMICDTYNDLIYEYNEMICYLGYVLLFGVAAPLTPFIVLVFAYIEKYFDTYKIFFLVRVELVSMSKGLEIYNVIIQAFIYVGLLTNLAVIVFGDNLFLPDKNFEYKMTLYAMCEIPLFIICMVMQWNIYPTWFRYVPEVKDLYNKKYYLRNSKNLPHLMLNDQNLEGEILLSKEYLKSKND